MNRLDELQLRKEMYEERAAIREYDGDEPKVLAEINASKEVKQLSKDGYFNK